MKKLITILIILFPLVGSGNNERCFLIRQHIDIFKVISNECSIETRLNVYTDGFRLLTLEKWVTSFKKCSLSYQETRKQYGLVGGDVSSLKKMNIGQCKFN